MAIDTRKNSFVVNQTYMYDVLCTDVSELSFFMLSRGIFLRVHSEFFQAALECSYGKTLNSAGDRQGCKSF